VSAKLSGVPELVAIDLPGGEAFVDALQRVWEAGEAALPVDQRVTSRRKEELYDSLGPAAVIGPEGRRNRPGGRRSRPGGRPVEPGDALVMATSGTTGIPKGVVLTHAAVEASARATSARLGVDPGRHRWLACLPLNHVGGLSVVTRSLVTSTPLTVLPRFEPAPVEALAGPDVLVSLVTTALRRTRAALFHTVVLGGSPPPDGLPPNVVTTYGMTETGSGVVYDGRPLDGVEVDVDQAGEIRLRGPMLLRAYRDGTVPLDGAGWLRTGDLGSLDPDGRLTVAGRKSDLIVSGGENIWPGPVEDAIRAHPGVADVAVAGRPDPEWGEAVVAWVVPADPDEPPALADLRALVADRVARFAAPRRLVITGELPRTSIGKVRREALAGGETATRSDLG
jgi:o-succinylbenzoate---CoA ligase